MNNAIKAAIQELDLRILEFTNARNALVALGGETAPGQSTAISATPPLLESEPVKTKRKYTLRKTTPIPEKIAKLAGKLKPLKPGKAPNCTSAEMFEVIGRKLKVPFTAGDLAAATGCDLKQAANVITRWKLKDWVQRVARGAFEHTAAFGGGAPAPAAKQDAEVVKVKRKYTRREVERAAAAAPAAPVVWATPAERADELGLPANSVERKVYYCLKHMPELFSVESAAVDAGISADLAGFALTKLVGKGLVKKADVEDGVQLYKLAR